MIKGLETMTSNYAIKAYSFRDVDYYMERIPETIVKKLSEEERTKLKGLIASTLPQPAPKLIDLRFEINLIVARYFFVLFVGNDRYAKLYTNQRISQDSQQYRRTSAWRRFAHRLTAVLLFLIINLMTSVCIIAFAYLTARFLGFHPLA